jgi:threonine dehydratase
MNSVPTKQDIIAAHERIRAYIHKTPVLTSQSVDELGGCQLFFKCENFQKIGAFKARGAMNAALSLSQADLQKGLATHSSGNHAQALARAAKILKTKSFIVMPRTSPDIKKKGVRAFGGEIFECEPTLEARESTLAKLVERTGATEIHPFNNYDVMAGQATATKELIEEVQGLDVIMVPVGGGGLLSGTALAVKYFLPTAIVIAGEPEGADDAYRSLKSGRIEESQSDSVADGLLTKLGDKTFPVIKDLVKEIIVVNDREIVTAMRLLWERLKIIVEPSCAVPFAALLKNKEQFAGKRVGIIMSGGNVDLARAFRLFLEHTS